MSELHGLNRKSEQMKQKKIVRTVIEMSVCFIMAYIPLFVSGERPAISGKVKFRGSYRCGQSDILYEPCHELFTLRT